MKLFELVVIDVHEDLFIWILTGSGNNILNSNCALQWI